MKEHKCKKCRMTYRGLKTTCPYCHKSTRIGVINKIMCVIGYITFFTVAGWLIWYEITKAMVLSIFFVPAIVCIAVIAIIILFIVALVS